MSDDITNYKTEIAGDLQGRLRAAEERAEKAEQTMYRWRSAFQSVTPGGSEFMDPESVLAFMRRMKDETVTAIKNAARSKKDARLAEAQATRMMKALTERDEPDLAEFLRFTATAIRRGDYIHLSSEFDRRAEKLEQALSSLPTGRP